MKAAFAALRATLAWRLVVRQGTWVWAMLLLGVVNLSIAAVSAETLRSLIDDGIVDRTQEIGPLATTLAVLAVFGAVAGFAQLQVTARIGYQVEYELRCILWGALQGAKPGALDALTTGQLVTRAITDLQSLQIVVVVLPTLALGIFTLLGLLIFTFVINPVLAVLALSTVPVNYFFIRRNWPRLRALSWLRLDSRARVTTVVDENVRGIRVVKAFAKEADANATLRGRATEAYAIALARVRLLARLDLFLKSVPVMVDGLILFAAVHFIRRGSLSIGEFALVLSLTRVLTSVAQGFDELADGATDIDAGSNRISELLATPDRSDGRGEPKLPSEHVGVELRVVTGDSHLDIDATPGRVTLLANAGEAMRHMVVALFSGSAGSHAGGAVVDGVDVATLHVDELLENVAIVGEEPFLFGRTLRENLTLASGDAMPSDESLRSALAAAGAEEIEAHLPGGLDAVLGDRGFTLSGGERQRVALARAMLARPRVLVLNDALSAVNPALEVEIVRRVRAFCPKTSVLVMAKRPSAAPAADTVIDASSLTSVALPSAVASESSVGDAPLDPTLAHLVAEYAGAPTETPDVAEDVATESDRIPTVRHVLAPFARPVAVVSAVLVVFTLVSLVPPVLIAVVVDKAEGKDYAAGNLAALGLLGVAVVTGIAGYFLTLYYGRVDEGILYLLRRRILARLLRLPVAFYDRELPGAVATRAVRDLDVISLFVDGGVYLIAIGLALGVGTMAALLLISPPTAIVVAGFALVLAIITLAQMRLADRAFTRQRGRYEAVITRLQEDFAGRDVISGLGAGQAMGLEFSEAGWQLRQADRWSTSLSNAYESVSALVGQLASAALYYTAGRLALRGELTTGTVIALQAYLGGALLPVQLFSGVLRFYLAARVSFRKLQELYVTGDGPVSASVAGPVTTLDGGFVLERIHFSYPGTEREVLRDLSLRIEPGEFAAIVGPTGAGKSSVAKLLWRVYDPNAGTIEVDGTPLPSLDVPTFRRSLGVVPQDAFLFAGTVASNIAYGRPEASRGEVERAAREVGAHSTLSALAGGFDEVVQEEGRNLEAEVRQMIALARAWLVEPDVLILDEATSALDAAQEADVVDAVRRLGKTTVVIAHRLQVAEQADRVVFLQDGTAVAAGHHDELLASCDEYRQLWGVASAPRQARPSRSKPNAC